MTHRKLNLHTLALWAALPMARTAQVESRLKMILKPNTSRRALTRRAVLLALVPATAAVGIVAALRPAAQAAPSAPLLSALTAQVSAAAPNSHTSAPVTVQLVGVGNSQKLQWWSQTGALLPKPVFDFANSPLSSAASQRGLHGVLFAFRLPPAAQGVTVDYRLSNSLLTSSAGGWVSKSASGAGSTEAQAFSQTNGVRVLKADFPASASQTNIRVGIASGPWRTTATSTPSASGQMSGSSSTQADNTVYIIGEPTETTDGAVCTVSVGGKSYPAAQDIRLVAVTTQGQEVLPTSIGDNSANSVEQITAKFSLPPSQIKMVKLQTRPFHYVQFKNVALRPLESKNEAAPIPGITPAATAAATARLRQIYGFLQTYRQTHNSAFPVHTTTLIRDITLNPKRYGLPDQGLGNQAQTLHFFTSPDSRFMDGNYGAGQFVVYFTHNKRPDKTMVGTAKSAGTRDVFAYTNLFVRNHSQRTAGFYLVLWDDGTVSQIPTSSILAVPAYDIIGPAGLVGQTAGQQIKQIAFPGQAGLPHG